MNADDRMVIGNAKRLRRDPSPFMTGLANPP